LARCYHRRLPDPMPAAEGGQGRVRQVRSTGLQLLQNTYKTAASIKSACFRAGVEVVEVNPAYTSVIGAVNHARSKGISTHQGAAYAIARRGLEMSERPTCRVAVVPARKGGHVTFALPVRNRAKHVGSLWSNVKTGLKAAHRAHFRCGAHKDAPPPLPRATPAVCYWISTVRFGGVNRSLYCSVSVLVSPPKSAGDLSMVMEMVQ
jgi:hypothetical protein